MTRNGRRPLPKPRSAPLRRAAPVRRTLRKHEYEAPLGGYFQQKLVMFIFFAIVAGGVFAFQGWQDLRRSRGASPTPQRLSLERLAQRGPGANAHVEITDFAATIDYVVQEEETFGYTRWRAVWIGLVPRGGDYDRKVAALEEGEPAPKPAFRVLMRAYAGDEEKLEALLSKNTLRGLVTNKISPMTDEEQELVQEVFPEVAIGSCWVFEQGRGPPEKPSLVGMWIGLIVCLGGIGGVIWWTMTVVLSKRRNAQLDHARLERMHRRNAGR